MGILCDASTMSNSWLLEQGIAFVTLVAGKQLP